MSISSEEDFTMSGSAPAFKQAATPFTELTEDKRPWLRYVPPSVWTVVLLITLSIPFLDISPVWIGTVMITLVYIPAALGQNLILGNAGLLAMGQAAFMGVGAYAAAVLSVRTDLGGLWTLLAAVVVSGVIGALVGIPALRIRGDYLFIVSLGFNLMMIDMAVKMVDVTGGATGLSISDSLTIGGWDVGFDNAFYFFFVGLVLVTCFATWAIGSSRFGKTIEALRDDTPAALSIGIRPDVSRVAIFAIGCALAGVSGWMLTYYLGFVGPPSFRVNVSVLIFEMAVIGGLGRVSGSIVGAIIIIAIPELLRPLQDYRDIIGGVFIVILMVVRPQGLLGKTKIVNLIKK